MQKFFLILVLLFSTAIVNAGNVVGKKITGYIASQNAGRELFIFQTEGQPTEGCNETARFAVDSNSPLYKGVQTAVIAAYHSNSDVSLSYLNSCNALGNAADIQWVCVGNLPC